MPSGITEGILSGDDFETFAWKAVRHCGMLARYRDNGINWKIPDKFECTEDRWAKNRLKEANDKLELLLAMTEEEAEKLAHLEYLEAVDSYHNSILHNQETARKYNAILEQVEEWQQPDETFEGLKEFMRQQIIASIQWDVHVPTEPTRLSGSEWKAREMRHWTHAKGFSEADIKREQKFTEELNIWVQKFRDSLKKN